MLGMRSLAGHSGRAQKDFGKNPAVHVNRSTFNRSSGLKTTIDSGFLYPIFVDEVLPGDTFKMSATLYARLTSLIRPVMDNLYMDTHFFFCPTRLVWDKWEKFNGAQDKPGDSTDFLIPTLRFDSAVPSVSVGSLFDYMGLPPATYQSGAKVTPVSALPFRCHNLIYNEWFRDQNMIDSKVENTGDGPDATTDYGLYRRGKRHDYFTSCLPFPQKGETVKLPLGTTAPVSGIGIAQGAPTAPIQVNVPVHETSGDRTYAAAYHGGESGGYQTKVQVERQLDSDFNARPNVYADLSGASAASINDLRNAFMVQRVLELDARGGTRYIEQIYAQFGVVNPDFRLQRPEYLGGSSAPITIEPIPQTSATAGSNPQANLAGLGVGTNSGAHFAKSFTEHGYILGYVSIRADLTYQQGLDRLWSRRDRFDFYLPSFAHLGEQSVPNSEIYLQTPTEIDDPNEDVFGYQERWAELRYKNSKITGKLRSVDSGSLDVWHLAQNFTSLPALNQAFIEETPPVDRIVAVPSEPEFVLDCHFGLTCARCMPTYGIPGFTPHM